jgi:hypothetical protein
MRVVAVLMLLSAYVAASCSASAGVTCSTDGGPNATNHYSMTQLPSGTCSQNAGQCSLTTQDLCPAASYPGPEMTWSCSCTGSMWQCQVTGQSKATCYSPDSAGN